MVGTISSGFSGDTDGQTEDGQPGELKANAFFIVRKLTSHQSLLKTLVLKFVIQENRLVGTVLNFVSLITLVF